MYLSILLTGAYKAHRIKAFSPLIVRRQPAFSGRLKFFACGGQWRRRICSISPGWNRGEKAGRRQCTAFVPFDEAKQSPTIHPKAGQQRGTTCTAGSRKCFARTRILRHRQGRGSSRRHSCSIDEPAFLPGGTGNRS